ncbi:MAG: hypothetical protein NTX55_01665 [Candidatus Parcubacteria bacterium]|nr:hypothetical protein [Candidatus Parcubacteria bacterium]
MKEIILFLCIFLLIFILLLEIENTGPVFEARGIVVEKGYDRQLQFFLLKTETEKEPLLIYVDEGDFEKISERTRVFIKFRKSRITGMSFALEIRIESRSH